MRLRRISGESRVLAGARYPNHLGHAGFPFQEKAHRGLAEAPDSPAARGAGEVVRRATRQDFGGRPGIDGQDLEDGPAPLVSGVAAARTASARPDRPAGDLEGCKGLRFPGRDRGLAAASAADGADEPLGDDAHQRRADQKARHAKIGEAGDRTGGVVRVERG